MAKVQKPAKPDLSYIVEPLRAMAVPIGDLVPDPHNANLHNSASIDAIRGSLQKFGQTKPIAVQAEGMIVRAGNGRLTAARQLGWTHLAAVVLSGRDERFWKAFALADNRTAELSEWDYGQLEKTLAELEHQIDNEEVTAMFESLSEEVERELAAAARQTLDNLPPDPELTEKQTKPTAKPFRIKITCSDAAQQLAILAECHKQGWAAESF